ncbi:hypothetical protein HY992_06120 [Candidatus Micrarchaeota archaeon]|nr:hypothetical protein [Candidatus Micrarchaeota archaeon]
MPLVFLLSFLAVFALTPFLIKKLKNMRFVSKDENKYGKPEIPKYGGITIVLGFTLATLLSLQLSSQLVPAELMIAAVCTITIISFLGFVDDVLKLRDIYRVVLPAFAALPLMAVKAGHAAMYIPLVGNVNFDLGVIILPFLGPVSANLYILLLIPIGVVACSNLVNLLAGFNGLEAGVGAIVCGALLAAALLLPTTPGTITASFILLAMLGACIAFLLFNWFPAKIFPGNLATYALGATIVAAVVTGNMERVGVIALTPQIIEFFMKARTLFQAENFGDVKNGKLHYAKPVSSLTHLLMRLFQPTEQQLVAMLLAIQAIFGIIAISSLYW